MKITSAEFVISNTDVNKCPKTGLPEYAFIGRSNVGKSSLINMLTGNKKLAMTSSTPGKTLLINHFLINKQWYLVDLPGYGYANRSKKGVADIQRVIGSYLEKRMEMTCLFVLIDSRLEPQKIDVDFMSWLGENQVPFAIVFTKADKQSKSRTESNIKVYLEKLKEQWEELPPHFVTSSLSGAGKDDMLAYIDSVNSSLKKN
ncbi:MAG: YihA family ribosome biogenesis GTP-binding protein [Bacteroidaceae bacterium]|nr:YihA family ribosome biogenesis GTP-binding protein [Bacteroidaceae bacterium]